MADAAFLTDGSKVLTLRSNTKKKNQKKQSIHIQVQKDKLLA